MTDPIFTSFLKSQYVEGLELARQSDLLDLVPVDGTPVSRYLARFSCRGLVRSAAGEVRPADRFDVGIWFHDGYLLRADPCKVLTWLGPRDVFHPNISADVPVICLGRITSGTTLVELLFRCFELITYQKVTMREDDALNRHACRWARRNQDRFPVDRRPLKRRTVQVRIRPLKGNVS
ncbi:MAG: hypothetical protein ACE5HD_01865 [Acidobacteriota bacterium]